jgi:hypothetical protein
MSSMSYMYVPVGEIVFVGAVLVPPAAAADRRIPPDAHPVPETSFVEFQVTSVSKFGVALFVINAIRWVARDRSTASCVASHTSTNRF